jgi:NAD+ synthetase
VSGGIDSALICALARPVCEKLDIPLIGRSLPIISNKTDELARAEMVGKSFCTEFATVDLSKAFWTLKGMLFDDKDAFDESFGTSEEKHKIKVREGNIKARLRMIQLYDLAQKNNGMVLSTDNYTELMLGFWTLHGDVGDYGMIQNLWKTEVYKLSEWIANNQVSDHAQKESLELCVVAVPTDGLGITNSDLDQLGAETYEEVDGLLDVYLHPEKAEKYNVPPCHSKIAHPVIKRHESTHFKRNNPGNIPRNSIV